MTDKIKIVKLKDGKQKVMLTLPDKNYKAKRCIGIIEHGTLNLFRSGTNHLHRNTGGSIGINYKLVRDYSDYYNRIAIHFNDKTFYTDREFIMQQGTFRDYGMNGLERQIFVKIDDLQPIKQAELRLAQIKLSKMQTAKQMQTSIF